MNLPPYADFPVLVSEKVKLKNVSPEDLIHLLEISFYDAVQADSLEMAATMQDKINRDYQNSQSIHWAIVDQHSNNIVGTCGYYRGFKNGVGELGCILLPIHRGQGYMRAAFLLAIDFGINQIGLKCICANTHHTNENAKKLLLGLGFIKMLDLQDGYEFFEYQNESENDV
jgi:ribosomal-protein-alanine N-acetyltransferase